MKTTHEEALFLSQIFSNVKPVSFILQMLAKSLSPIVITDAGQQYGDYRIIYANDAFCRLNGYSLAEIVGQSPKILQGENSNYAVLKKLRAELNSKGHFRGISQNYRKDKTCYPVAWDISSIKNDDGEVELYISIQRDLTVLVERARSTKDLNEQVRNWLHDLSTGKLTTNDLKSGENSLLKTLKDNASTYAASEINQSLHDDDDLFLEIEAMDFVRESAPGAASGMTATEYLAQQNLTSDEVNALIENLRSIEEEVECLTLDGSDIAQIDFIREKIAQLSDDIFFLVEFTDTSLALSEVAETLATIEVSGLSTLHISILKSLVEEVDNWLVEIFVSQTAENVYVGAKSVNSAAKQFVSFVNSAKPE